MSSEEKLPDSDTPDTISAAFASSSEETEMWRKKASEYKDLAQRERAEFENYQKRSQRDREQERKYAFTPIVFDLLPVLDNLDRALQAAKQAGEKGALTEGVSMVQTQFLEMLKRHGIVRIDALHKPFDPNQHQAIMQKPTPDLEPNTVIQVVEQGFLNQDRVLRPAKVIVSSKA